MSANTITQTKNVAWFSFACYRVKVHLMLEVFNVFLQYFKMLKKFQKI